MVSSEVLPELAGSSLVAKGEQGRGTNKTDAWETGSLLRISSSNANLQGTEEQQCKGWKT